ncbi:MAG TPA: alpha/beta hydrolase [Stellaceae bacterium]|nr:alpha/beta hydrolase [Stellaceae bacterium]
MNDSFVEIGGAKLLLRRRGSGEPLLFLHGIQGLPGWTEALSRLAEHFTLIAPDHPGFGGSDTPDWIDDVDDLAFFYLDLLQKLADGRVHIVGHSLGGWIAMAMAIRSTAQIQSLTLVDSAGISVPGVKRGDMFIGSPQETGRLLFAGEEPAARWAAAWQASDELKEIYDKNRAAAAKYTWQPRLHDPRLAKWLHRINVPVHIVWGEADWLIPLAHGEALKRAIGGGGAALTVVPGVGHLCDIEAPAAFAEAVVPFIAGLKPEGSRP